MKLLEKKFTKGRTSKDDRFYGWFEGGGPVTCFGELARKYNKLKVGKDYDIVGVIKSYQK